MSWSRRMQSAREKSRRLPSPQSQRRETSSHCTSRAVHKVTTTRSFSVDLQWTIGQPEKGLRTPLREWPIEWYSGRMSRCVGAKFHQRKMIAREYIRYVWRKLLVSLHSLLSFRSRITGWGATGNSSSQSFQRRSEASRSFYMQLTRPARQGTK